MLATHWWLEPKWHEKQGSADFDVTGHVLPPLHATPFTMFLHTFSIPKQVHYVAWHSPSHPPYIERTALSTF